MKVIVFGRSERNDGERLIQIHTDIHMGVMFFDSEAIFFLIDRTSNDSSFKILTITDKYNREYIQGRFLSLL